MAVPVRRCAGCGVRRPRDEMVRVVADKDGEVYISNGGWNPGRGAYVCPDKSCLKKARDGKKFQMGLRADVADTVFEKLEILIGGREEGIG